MNFLEYYKPKNLWKLINNELNPKLDEYSMLYVTAASNFANLCKCLNCNDFESFYDVYTGISNSALTLYKIYGFGEVNTRELILYGVTFGAKKLDIYSYRDIITNIIKFGDKKIIASYLGCLSDMASHLGIDRVKDVINSNQILEKDKLNKLKQG